MKLRVICIFLLALSVRTAEGNEESTSLVIERVTTIAPFPRGLVMKDNELYVLCRGRVRGAGGVSAKIEDQAGTIYAVDPEITQPISESIVSDKIRTNGCVVVEPTEPPFKLWNRDANPPWSDRETDRPYCTLRWHDATQSFYLCAFSGIDKPKKPGDASFSKNVTDAVLRYDLRTSRWYEVERHNIEAGGNYPHHDPNAFPSPHGWLNGPDNCLIVNNNLYVVSKDNSLLVRYDLSELVKDPEAGYPPSEIVMGDSVFVEGRGMMNIRGHSALAHHDNWLYVAFRTTSEVIRIRLDDDGFPFQPIVAQLLAQFKPYDPKTETSANITDITLDSKGRLYVLSAMPAKIYRFIPNKNNVFVATDDSVQPWLNLADRIGNPKMKSENILIDALNRLFVTSGDGYDYQAGAHGTVYRVLGIK